jgi:hypothetical protein
MELEHEVDSLSTSSVEVNSLWSLTFTCAVYCCDFASFGTGMIVSLHVLVWMNL